MKKKNKKRNKSFFKGDQDEPEKASASDYEW
jgi:hypothetical protein